MMAGMKQRLLRWTFALIAIVVLASPALARQDQEHEIYDARLEGYADSRNVTLEGGSMGLTWFFFVVLGGVALIAMFKDARRSHLD